MSEVSETILIAVIIASVTYLLKQICDFVIFSRYNKYNEILANTMKALSIYRDHWTDFYNRPNPKENVMLIRSSASELYAFSKQRHWFLLFLPSKNELLITSTALFTIAEMLETYEENRISKHEVETNEEVNEIIDTMEEMYYVILAILKIKSVFYLSQLISNYIIKNKRELKKYKEDQEIKS